MIPLIKKDFVFNYKWVVAFVSACIFMPIVYVLGTDNRLTPIVFLLGPVLANGLVFPKSCYLDDNLPTRIFLNTLPLSINIVIGSKYVFGLMCTCISLLVISLVLWVSISVVAMQSIVISFSWLILYDAVFLLSFFAFNYSVAEKANQSMQILTIALMFFLDRTGIVLDSMAIAPVVLVVMAAFSLLTYALSFLLSVWMYKRKRR